MVHDSATTSVLMDASTILTPRDWFAGAGDDRDHSIRSRIPDESGFLTTLCGRLSAHGGRIVNRPCPACQGAARTSRPRSSEERMLSERMRRSALH